jgi:uncharacterized protein YndB with AHSA1/START domain
MNHQPFVIERVFDAPVAIVWDALTNNEKMKKWYFQLSDFKPVVGFEFTFTGGADEHNPYLHICRVVDMVPNKKIAYTWRYDGLPGITTVSIELSAEAKKTKLKLTHEGLETLVSGGPDFARKNFEEGWSYILDKSLKGFLEETPAQV